MRVEEKVDKAGKKQFGAVDLAVLLLILQFFSRLPTLLANSRLEALDDDKLVERNAIRQGYLTATAFFRVSIALT